MKTLFRISLAITAALIVFLMATLATIFTSAVFIGLWRVDTTDAPPLYAAFVVVTELAMGVLTVGLASLGIASSLMVFMKIAEGPGRP